MTTAREIADQIRETIKDLDRQRVQLARALAVLDPDRANVVPLKRPGRPRKEAA